MKKTSTTAPLMTVEASHDDQTWPQIREMSCETHRVNSNCNTSTSFRNAHSKFPFAAPGAFFFFEQEATSGHFMPCLLSLAVSDGCGQWEPKTLCCVPSRSLILSLSLTISIAEIGVSKISFLQGKKEFKSKNSMVAYFIFWKKIPYKKSRHN